MNGQLGETPGRARAEDRRYAELGGKPPKIPSLRDLSIEQIKDKLIKNRINFLKIASNDVELKEYNLKQTEELEAELQRQMLLGDDKNPPSLSS